MTATAFEHSGQVIRPIPAAAPSAPTATAQAAATPATARWAVGAWPHVLAYAVVMGTLGAHMVTPDSWFILAWFRAFGWHGAVGAPLSLMPLGVVLAVCAMVTWGASALLRMATRR